MNRPNRRTISVLLVVVALVVSTGPALGAAVADAPSPSLQQDDTDEQDTTNETDDSTNDTVSDDGEDDNVSAGDSEDTTTENDSDDSTTERLEELIVEELTIEQVTIENVEITVTMEGENASMADGEMDDEEDGADTGVGTDSEEDDAADNETDADTDDADADGESFEVSNLDAPDEATVGDTLEVSAEVSNPSDEEQTQEVEFRLDGDVVERQDVTLEGGESDTVTFEIESEGLESGEYVHGVLSEDFGELDTITLQKSDEDEEADTDADTDDEEAADDQNASVTFEDQESDGSTVTVDGVNLSDGGFVTIHNSSLTEEGDALGSVVGTSEYLESGEHADVEVELFNEEAVPGAEFDQEELEEDQTLIAMPHLDTNDNETYDFVETGGEEDGPYTEDGEAVTDAAEITLADGEDTDDNATADDGDTMDNETDGETGVTDDGEEDATDNESTTDGESGCA
jgi:hypothetical protein